LKPRIIHRASPPLRDGDDADQGGDTVIHTRHPLWGERFLDLAFEVAPGAGRLLVHPPLLPAQAIPGIYMLFVVDDQGVPCVARKVVLGPLGPAG
jgi:hypothetical protein